MKTYIISYWFRDNTINYMDFYDAIKFNYPRYQHMLEDSWLIRTDETADEIVSKLREKLPLSASIFVAEITDNCEGWIGKGTWEWLKNLN